MLKVGSQQVLDPISFKTAVFCILMNRRAEGISILFILSTTIVSWSLHQIILYMSVVTSATCSARYSTSHLDFLWGHRHLLTLLLFFSPSSSSLPFLLCWRSARLPIGHHSHMTWTLALDWMSMVMWGESSVLIGGRGVSLRVSE